MEKDRNKPHVLCLRFSALGDVAMSSVVLRSFAQDNPGTRFTLAGPALLEPLFRGVPNLSLFPVDKKESVLTIYRTLRRLDVTYVADLHSVLRTFVIRTLFFLSGKRVVFLKKERKARRRLLEDPEGCLPLTHMCELYAATLRKLHLDSPSFSAGPYIPMKEGPLKRVGVAPFAKHEGKQWRLGPMHDIVCELAEQGVEVFLFGGGEEEQSILDEWADAYNNVTNVVGGGSFEEELNLIRTLDVMVSMDSANMHFASAVGIPVISIWCATHPKAGFYGWRQDPRRAIQLPLDCRPCSIFGAEPCRKGTYECTDARIMDMLRRSLGLIPRKLKTEIMAPAGNWASLTAAAQAGAGSVYFGVGRLNMRAHAALNFTMEDLPAIVEFCIKHGMRSYLTVNTIFYNQDLEELRMVLHAAKKADISAVIASDMAAILEARAIGLEVHASTQLNVSNIEALKFFARFADVIVLARELSLEQIREIARQVKEQQIKGPSGELVKLELFCHGALCMAVSGKCYLSLHEYNKSANRGACYQICRRSYLVEDKETGAQLEIDNQYIMSPKDLCTVTFIDQLLDAGIEVLKIEGRARAPEYVKATVSAYRDAVMAYEDGLFTPELSAGLEDRLKKVFNRGFWGGYYLGSRLGEWSTVYGSQATEKKTYVAKVTNYFTKQGVAELLIEAAPLKIGDHVLVIGPTTGVKEITVTEIRIEGQPANEALQGTTCSVPVIQKLRRSDKVYRLES